MLDRKRYTERPEAGETLALPYRRINEGRKKDDYDLKIGAYHRFRLYLSFDPLSAGLALRGSSRYNTNIGSSGQGAIIRIENLVERISSYLTYARRGLEEVQRQLEAARQQMGWPLTYEGELSEKVATLTEVNARLEFKSLQG